jgi:peptidoglycan/xylan/chitin deacetylase (PgdA/CDA1 family)
VEQTNNHPHFDPAHSRSPIEPAHKGRAQRLVEIAELAGAVRAARHLHDRLNSTITILAYHRVIPADAPESYPLDPELISATPQQFDWQMRHLREHRNLVSLRDVIAYLDEGTPLPRAAVAVTFDDGFSDTYRYAFPILKRYKIPATIFVSTGYVDSQTPFWFELVSYLIYRIPSRALKLHDERAFPLGESHGDRTASLRYIHGILKDLPNCERVMLLDRWTHEFSAYIAHDAIHHSLPISWTQIHQMALAGIDFGSHTVTHPNLTRLPDQDLDKELSESKRQLEARLQRPIESIAYPIGTRSAFDQRVTTATARNGFKVGLTYVPGANLTNRINRFEMQRHGIGRTMSPSYFRALMSLPSWLN